MQDETPPGGNPSAQIPKYDQAFFVALAAKGKDAWNKWRCDPANKDVRVTFEGVDFTEVPRDQINFEGFEFGDCAKFSKCRWRGPDLQEAVAYSTNDFAPGLAFFVGATFGQSANFYGSRFGDRANFVGAAFGHFASFRRAIFGSRARFAPAHFGNGADFTGATFGSWADFTRAAFGDAACFTGAAFGDAACFAGAAFGNGASFDGAAFGNWAHFENAVFNGAAFFRGMSEEQWVTNIEMVCEEELLHANLQQGLQYRLKRDGSGGLDRFLSISFATARFEGEATFSGRSFETTANFTNARFYSPPDFEWCGGTARIDLTGAQIRFVPAGKWLHWTENSLVPVRLRAFRKVAEETKNHDLERDLYIEERKAERGVYLRQRWEELKREGWKSWPSNAAQLFARYLWIIVMGVYWALADYGRSFARPFAWLVASGFFFYWCYGKILAPISPKACPVADQYDQVIRMLALGNTVPFVGPLTIDSKFKDFLFCPLNNCPAPIIPPEGYQLAVLSQNLLSIILVFFIGLALRNYFKIK